MSFSLASKVSARRGSGTPAEYRRLSAIDTRRVSLTTSKAGRPSLGEIDSKLWLNSTGKSVGLLPYRNTFGPLFLIVASPVFILLACATLVEMDGSVQNLLQKLKAESLFSLYRIWPTFSDVTTLKIISLFMVLQLILMRLIPGRVFDGPVTASGNVPTYRANGLQCYSITVLLFVFGAYFGLYDGGIIYDHIGHILSSMNVFAILFCLVLYVKGRIFPSSTDSGSSGNFIFDFYWGTELYPRILGWDIKQFTNCRCGMMFWPLAIISYALKQRSLYGNISSSMLVNVSLQLIYITKFFYWESGYMASIDIMHDRAGFYICWGVLVWLPCVYTSHSMYLVKHPHDLGLPLSIGFFLCGVFFIWMNFDADRQRQHFRKMKGNCKIWGCDPYFIEAKYKTEKGEVKTNLLLGSGWWGISRHFHYIPEVLAAVCWTLPVLTDKYLPYFYVPYLLVLLLDRAVRDDNRCHSKYGKYWEVYCKKVPFVIVPYVY